MFILSKSDEPSSHLHIPFMHLPPVPGAGHSELDTQTHSLLVQLFEGH